MPRLEVLWRQSVDLEVGQYETEGEFGPEGMFITPYDGAIAATNQLVEQSLALVEGALGDDLVALYGYDENHYRTLESKNHGRRFVYGPMVEAGTMVLFGGAVRHAKQQANGLAKVSLEEWAALGFDARNLDIWDGTEESGLFVQLTGEKDTGKQRASINLVAAAIMGSSLLNQQVETVFSRELATLQTK